MIEKEKIVHLGLMLAWMSGHSASSIESSNSDIQKILEKMNAEIKKNERNFDIKNSLTANQPPQQKENKK